MTMIESNSAGVFPIVSIEMGDITKADVDAVVNAANPIMLGGGGVDGAIHNAAGPELLDACRRIPVKNGVRCPPGEARITPGFNLSARHVIHTVGPIYDRDLDPESTLRSAYDACLTLAVHRGLRSIAFPAISTGVYGFPLEPAASIALSVTRNRWDGVGGVRFILFTDDVFNAFSKSAAGLGIRLSLPSQP